MTRYIAFLRAINVGHGRTLTMETLRRYLKPLDLEDVTTFIGSGNVMFSSSARSPRALEEKIEERLRQAMKVEVPTFLRTEAELARIAVYQPFASALAEPDDEVNIIFLAGELDETTAQNVVALTTETDEFVVHEREIYWLRRRKAVGPAYSTVALERVLQRPFTIRTSRTVRKIAAKYSEAYQSLFNLG